MDAIGDVHARIRSLLREQGAEFRELHHGPTRTSEESAKARGEELKNGGKSLLLKVGDDFRLFVFSAALALDSRSLKGRFGTRYVRFATKEELLERTGLVPGSVPPFGYPVLPFELFVDTSIEANERIAFNAGSLTDSVIMPVADYLRVAKPVIFTFASPRDAGPTAA